MKKKNNTPVIIGVLSVVGFLAWREARQAKKLRQAIERQRLEQLNFQRQQYEQQQKQNQQTPVKEEKIKAPILTQEETKKLWYRLQLQYHPDYAKSEEDKKFRNNLTAKINKAYHDNNIEMLLMFQLDK